MIVRLMLWLSIAFLAGCANFTTQFVDIPAGFEGGKRVVVRTYGREGLRFFMGTDYVIPYQQRCVIGLNEKGEEIAETCKDLEANIASSETFFEHLITGAAIGAFFPLIRPSTTNVNTSTSSTSSAQGGSVVNKIDLDIKGPFGHKHGKH